MIDTLAAAQLVAGVGGAGVVHHVTPCATEDAVLDVVVAEVDAVVAVRALHHVGLGAGVEVVGARAAAQAVETGLAPEVVAIAFAEEEVVARGCR